MTKDLLNPTKIEELEKTAETESGRNHFRYGNTENILSWKKSGEARILVYSISGRAEKGGHYIPALKIFGEIQNGIYHLLMKRS